AVFRHPASGMDFFKGTSTIRRMDGVSTYLALIFGTLLSSQGTDASFVLTRRTISGAFLRALPFGLAFPTLPDPFPVPFPVQNLFPVAVGSLLPFG
ncbi:hypothetical protein, partial [Streptomyces sp. NPDC002889]|uniref:hypothetical protein n=1 Tax=Streptomyces sp. NPDC002889 TaxID=3364669 RepID=UPI0036990E34